MRGDLHGRLVHALASPDGEVVRAALDELAEHAHAYRVDRTLGDVRDAVRGIVGGFLQTRPEHELFSTAIWVLGMLHDPETERMLVAIARRLVEDRAAGDALHQVYIALDNLGLVEVAGLDADLDRIEYARRWLDVFLASERVLAGPIDEYAFWIQAIDIEADWHDVGNVTALLRTRPRVAVLRSAFLSEWGRLLAVIAEAMASVGLQRHLGAERLRRALAMVPGTGRLYGP
jgi:hypothetical protein